MNLDFGEVLSHTWQITWKRRVLWALGILFGLFFSLIIPLSILPVAPSLFFREPDLSRMPDFSLTYVAAFGLFFLVMYPVSVIVQTSMTLVVRDADRGDEDLPLSEVLKRSLSFFWRVLGLMLLFGVCMTLLMMGIQAIMILLAIFTAGIGLLCATPLMLLMYPITFVATVWMEQSMSSVVIDGLRVSEAIRRGWQLLRNNPLAIVLMLLILYVGVGMITAVGVMPAMFPLLVVPFGLMEGEGSRTLVSVALLSEVVFLPFFILVFSWSMIFSKSAWVVTYLRLTRGPKSQSLAQPAGA